MQAIIAWLRRAGYDAMPKNYYTNIAVWRDWYAGKVKDVHYYQQYNGRKHIQRVRKSLGMAKTIAEDWANLIMNEKVDVQVEDENAAKQIQRVLETNGFRRRANRLVELTMAMGTGAFVEFVEGDNIRIDYIRADMIYPLEWRNGEIISCAFASEKAKEKESQVYLNIHERQEDGTYLIRNILFARNNESLTEIALPDGVEPEVQTGSTLPRFQIITPNLANNIVMDCPMGISVYANAVDQLAHLDLVFDSYDNEFRLGKKRLMIPLSFTRVMEEESGIGTPVFDDDDTEFYAIPGTEDDAPKEFNAELRADAHEKGIQTALNLVSVKCGMGNDRYNFQNGTAKTATEVVSEKSDLYQSLKKHEQVVEEAIVGLVQAIAEMLGLPEQKVSIGFDDSIIEDVGAEKTRFLQEIAAGVRLPWEYRVQFLGETEEVAKEMLQQSEKDDDPFGFLRAGEE